MLNKLNMLDGACRLGTPPTTRLVHWIVSLLLLFSLLFTASNLCLVDRCLAKNGEAPLRLVRNITNQMTEVLVKNRAQIARDDNYLIAKIEQIVLPNFDVQAMARSVVGRQYWQQASVASRNEFVEVFTRYVEDTYSGALKSYNGEVVKFYPLRGNSGTRAQVTCDLLLRGGTVRVVYNLYLKNGSWKIYDFSVNNISLVKNCNSQFAAVLRQQGLAGLVWQLKNKK